ncbi:MAG: twin-arginine translocation pathway signal protein [Betaproteobacteria bacterium]
MLGALGAFGAVAAAPLTVRALGIAVANEAQTTAKNVDAPACVLTPAVGEGPYFVDERLHRSDIAGGSSDAGVRDGVPLALKIHLSSVRDRSCRPIAGVQVDVWHASAIGQYSDEPAGFGQASTQGQTWLRGYQISDASGNVVFNTIYPGWYPGRPVHIHVKARLFSASGKTAYEFTSQLFFDDAVNDLVMALPTYNTRGSRGTRNANEGIRDDHHSLLARVTPMPNGARGYLATASLGLSLGPTERTVVR